jgi:hypothetical protein
MESVTTVPQMTKIDEFCIKHDICDSKEELVNLFNECMVCVATGILNMPGVQAQAQAAAPKKGGIKTKKPKVVRPKCQGKTKTGNDCKKYAVSGGLHCKTHAPKEVDESEPTDESSEETMDCNAICKNGEKCKQSGVMTTPEGAQHTYCFKHTKKWRDFEGTDTTNGAVATELTEFQEEERIANNMSKEEYLKASVEYDTRQRSG